MAAYYEFNGGQAPAPNYPTCPSVWNVLDCNSGQTNRPCCDQYKCYLEANNHMKCMGGSAAFPNSAFSSHAFDAAHPSGDEVMRNEIAAAGAHGVDFFAMEVFGGVRCNVASCVDVVDSVTSPTCDPFDSEMHLILRNEDAMQQAGLRWIIDLMNHGESHAGAYLTYPSFWDKAVENTVLAVSSPSYLRICGRPVVMIGNGFDLVTQAGSAAP